MFDFNKLMAISESATGFAGGSMVDEMPGYTLDECINTLPMVIMESQIEHFGIVDHQNEVMVEAAIEAASGMPVDFESMVEAGKFSLKESFEKFLNTIKSFIASIIVKIKALWARRKGDATKMIAKYEKSMKADKCKDLVFKGYDFDHPVDTKVKSDVQEIIGGLYDALKGGLSNPNADEGKLKEIKDKSPATVSMEIASKITGIQMSDSGDWTQAMQKKLFGYEDEKHGGKHEIKFGEHCFTIEKVKAMLLAHNNLQNLLNNYTVMAKDVDVQIKNVKNLQKHTEDNDENKSVLAYYDVFMSTYKNAATAVNKVNAMMKRYVDAQWVQASQMWIMMAQASGAKTEEKAEEAPAEDKAPEAEAE